MRFGAFMSKLWKYRGLVLALTAVGLSLVGLTPACQILFVPILAAPVLAASETFNFPPRANVAEILYTEQTTGPDGKKKIARKRILAQGVIHIPANAQLELHLRYDAPEQMQFIEQLSRLQIVTFHANNLDLDDTQLTHIKNFKPLYHVNLHATLVSDKSMPLLGTFKEIRDLRLSGTNVKGAGFEHLARLSQLFRLNLAALTLTPGTVAKLKPLMSHLLELNLSETGLTKEDFSNLAAWFQ